eukprot:CAMPEP_0184478828 /NCGR_PEP_ID=MMETSP0113_2-20130426/740_1 /TAXON_ID=91329 /ORGANISM="Norrisiella sphaerica, Strain BC52" /LENGTH=439 /DNA_ID=CAMNT_0026856739 /DNA_START=248 /DNA_END=1567 /DNA_ORIENTATION=-
MTSTRVALEGYAFERALCDRKKGDRDYQFLFNTSLPEHVYYRWRVYSLSNGDSLKEYRTAPFQITSNGPQWIPPRLDGSNGGDDEGDGGGRETERSSKRRRRSKRDRYTRNRARRKEVIWTHLSKKDTKQLFVLLRDLSPTRESVVEAMGFILTHSEDAKDITTILTESLTLRRTPIEKRIARLYLLSDVLYNDVLYNTSPLDESYSVYRDEFRERLLRIFKYTASAIRKLNPPEARRGVIDRVFRILGAWQTWNLFPEELISDLAAEFIAEGADIEELTAFACGARDAAAFLNNEEDHKNQDNNNVNISASAEDKHDADNAEGKEVAPHIHTLLGNYGTDSEEEGTSAKPEENSDSQLQLNATKTSQINGGSSESLSEVACNDNDGASGTFVESSISKEGNPIPEKVPILPGIPQIPPSAAPGFAKVHEENLAALEDL